MATPNGAATARAVVATLDARVQGLDRDYQDLKRTLLDLDAKIDQSITSLGTRFETSISNLSTKVEQKSVTQWPVIFAGLGVVLTVLTVVGTMAYMPIQRDTTRLDAAVATVIERAVFQREYLADNSRAAEERRNLRADLNVTVQQQRYNIDQGRLIKDLDEIRTALEATRLRTYDIHGRLSKIEQSQVDTNQRYDAVSGRLGQHIRDFVASMRDLDRGSRREQKE